MALVMVVGFSKINIIIKKKQQLIVAVAGASVATGT